MPDLVRDFGMTPDPDFEETVSIPLSSSRLLQASKLLPGFTFARTQGFTLPRYPMPAALFHPTFDHALVKLQRRRIILDITSTESEFDIARVWRDAAAPWTSSDMSIGAMLSNASDVYVAPDGRSSPFSRAGTSDLAQGPIVVHNEFVTSRASLRSRRYLDLGSTLPEMHLQVPKASDYRARSISPSAQNSSSSLGMNILKGRPGRRGSINASHPQTLSSVGETEESPAGEHLMPNARHPNRKDKLRQWEVSNPASVAAQQSSIAPVSDDDNDSGLLQGNHESLRHSTPSNAGSPLHKVHIWNNHQRQPVDLPRLAAVRSQPNLESWSLESIARGSSSCHRPYVPDINYPEMIEQSPYLRQQIPRSSRDAHGVVRARRKKPRRSNKCKSPRGIVPDAYREPDSRAHIHMSPKPLSYQLLGPSPQFPRSENRQDQRPRHEISTLRSAGLSELQVILMLQQGIVWTSSSWNYVKHKFVWL